MKELKDIAEEFTVTFRNEEKLANAHWTIPNFNELFGICYRLGEIAQSSLVLRSYSKTYLSCKEDFAYESVGAHTNLMISLVLEALRFYNTKEIYLAAEGYNMHNIIEAIQLHDLPENIIGDIPDNGSFDHDEKRAEEVRYYDNYKKYYPSFPRQYFCKTFQLLDEMEAKNSEIGRLLYCADKASAIIFSLQQDHNGIPPMLSRNNKCVSKRDREEMALCDLERDKKYRASEMWTIDWFKMRKLIKYDDTGFFTALIIMRTLQVNGCWYFWREKDYV